MFFDKRKLLRVNDSSLPIRVYLISTSLLKLTSLTTLLPGHYGEGQENVRNF